MTERLALPPKLGMKAAIAPTDDLRARLGADLVLEAGKTRHIGALGVQVLRAAALTWAKSGHSLTLVEVSDGCLDQLGRPKP